jgi:hypothetical protein
MKSILLFMPFFFLNFLIGQAQGITKNTTDTIQKGLSEEVFEQTKAAYLKMMETPTYIAYRKLKKEKRINDNGLKFTEDFGKLDFKSEEEFKAHFYKWYTEEDRIKKTKYKSIDDAVNTLYKVISSYRELILENKELYATIAKATARQAVEIMYPEIQMLTSE